MLLRALLLLLAAPALAAAGGSLGELLARAGLQGREQALLDEGWDGEGIGLATEQDLIDSGLPAREAQALLQALAGGGAAEEEEEGADPATVEVGLAAALARAGLAHRAQLLLAAGWESVEHLRLAELEDLVLTGMDRAEGERLLREVAGSGRGEGEPAPPPSSPPTPPLGRGMPTTWVNPDAGAAPIAGKRSKAVARLLANAACEQYADLLHAAGWDDLQTLKLASWLDLVYTGMKPGHAKRLHVEMHPQPLEQEPAGHCGAHRSDPLPPARTGRVHSHVPCRRRRCPGGRHAGPAGAGACACPARALCGKERRAQGGGRGHRRKHRRAALRPQPGAGGHVRCVHPRISLCGRTAPQLG